MSIGIAFAAGLALIVVGAELFTNAVEWAGFSLRLASGATGSLLAALGTALPETVVPIVALAGGQPSATSVATGALLGSPFLLLGLGVGLTSLAVLLRTRKRLQPDAHQVRRDLGLFLPAFAMTLVAIVLPHPLRYVIAAGLLLAYLLYVRATLRGGAPNEETPEPLHLVRWRRSGAPPAAVVVLQLLLAVAMLVAGSNFFVGALGDVAASLHTNPLTLALIVIPVATELPETLNSLLWVRSGDDTLAFGNVAGSAAFQACILGFIGLTFTPWSPDLNGVLSGLLTLATGAYVYLLLRGGSAHGRWLMLAGVPWVAYVIAEIVAGGRLG